MSSLLHSESDDSSTANSTPSLGARDLDTAVEERVPVSTSVLLQKPIVAEKSAEAKKISVRFSAIGSTAAINPAAFTVAETQTIATISKFLMKKLRLKTIHIYVSNSFSPTPDEKLGSLHRMFNTNGTLNLSYCESIAYG